jgi:alpha-glucosidase
MKRGVDGFRMDVVHLIVKDPDLRDNPPNPNANPDLHTNDIGGRQIHLYDRANPGIHEKMKEFRQITDQYGDTVIIGEIWEFNLGEWTKYYGDNDAVQLPFNFRLMEVPAWDAALFRQSVEELEAALPPFAQPNYVLSSHDKARIATRYGAAQARVAAMLLLTLRGTPTMYNGDEIGMRDGVITAEQVQDPQGKILGVARGRDGCRTPLQWDATPHAGFSTVQTWLPVNDDYADVNIARQHHDPQSMFSLYRELIALRRREPALHGGSYASLESPDGTYVYRREHDGQRFVVALNFTDAPVDVPLTHSGDLLLSTALDRQESVSGRVALRPNEGVIIRIG